MAIDVRTKTQEIVSQIDDPAFLKAIEDSLPEGVSVQRFVSVAKTAVRTSPDLVSADRTSLFGSIVKCAQDGLLPDGRQAALVIYKGKVSYLPMIDGIRAIAATYGWQIRTSVVYSDDEFEYTEEPPEILHRPVRPGVDRGDLIACYAVAQHRDGRRMQVVLHPADVAKRRAMAQTDQVWTKWPEAMWEKSAGHDIFKQLSLDPADARVDRILREGILADPLKALYGVDKSDDLRAGPEPSTNDPSPDGKGGPSTGAPVDGAKLEEAAGLGQAAFSPDPEEEDAVWEVAATDEEIEAAGAIVVPSGVHKDKTLGAVAADENGAAWFLTQLKKLPAEAPVKASLEVFVKGRLPDVWARYEAFKAEQS
jgi:recombination protein RecT